MWAQGLFGQAREWDWGLSVAMDSSLDPQWAARTGGSEMRGRQKRRQSGTHCASSYLAAQPGQIKDPPDNCGRARLSAQLPGPIDRSPAPSGEPGSSLLLRTALCMHRAESGLLLHTVEPLLRFERGDRLILVLVR